MLDSEALMDELQALKNDLSHRVKADSDSFFETSKGNAEALARQIKGAIDELGETLEQEEHNLEKLIAKHPFVAIASALTLGVAIGLMLRRH